MMCLFLSIQILMAQQNTTVTDSTTVNSEIKKEHSPSNQKTTLVFVSILGATAAIIGTTIAFATINITGKSGPKIVKNGAKLFF